MFEYISTRFQTRTVSVQLEDFNPKKFLALFPTKTQNVPFQSNINLFKFTYQMHLTSPESKVSDSRLTKFNDHVAYTRRITSGPHLNFDISDMNSGGKRRASETIGEALSRCLVIDLLKVQENTLEKIEEKVSGKQPDFKCTTQRQKTVICESKGSFTRISQTKINRALSQKKSVRGDIQIAAINQIGTLTRLIDPPIKEFKQDRFDRLIGKTNHYIQIFKLAGQRELTRYFKLMKLRFKNRNLTDFPEFSEKADLWFKLKYERQRKVVNNISFIGKVELIDNGNILFVGFDESLLNVDTFENFVDYRKDYINKKGDVTTYLSRDGVCFIEASRISLEDLFPDLKLSELRYYQEATELVDIDNMNELEFSNYLLYVFGKSEIEYLKEQKVDDKISDIVITYKGIKFYLELKLYSRDHQLVYSDKIKDLLEDRFRIAMIDAKPKKEIQLLPKIDLSKQILVTNIDKRLIRLPEKVVIFDRNDLKKLLKHPTYFKEFLSKLSS